MGFSLFADPGMCPAVMFEALDYWIHLALPRRPPAAPASGVKCRSHVCVACAGSIFRLSDLAKTATGHAVEIGAPALESTAVLRPRGSGVHKSRLARLYETRA